MVYPQQSHVDPSDMPFVRLEDSDLKTASRLIVHAWASSIDWAAGPPNSRLLRREIGLLEPYLAEAVVADHGADFVFSQWGGALDILCGGARCGHRLSAFPQPSRSHLRRVFVRAAATRMPAATCETWAIDGDIWRCQIMALPTEGDDFSVKQLLVALLFAPHPIVADNTVLGGFGWPAASLTGSVHGLPGIGAPGRRAGIYRLAGGNLGSLLKGLGDCF